MKAKGYLLAGGLALFCVCLAVVWAPTLTRAEDIVYEVRPQVAVPYGYTPEQSRLIDVIEHLLIQDRQATQKHLSRLETSLNKVMKKLNRIDKNLTSLSARIAAIETALGIEPPPPPQESSIESLYPRKRVSSPKSPKKTTTDQKQHKPTLEKDL